MKQRSKAEGDKTLTFITDKANLGSTSYDCGQVSILILNSESEAFPPADDGGSPPHRGGELSWEGQQNTCCLWGARCPKSQRLGLGDPCPVFPSTFAILIPDSCTQENCVRAIKSRPGALGSPPRWKKTSGTRRKFPPQPAPQHTHTPNSSFQKSQWEVRHLLQRWKPFLVLIAQCSVWQSTTTSLQLDVRFYSQH